MIEQPAIASEAVREQVARALVVGRFFVAADKRLRVEHVACETAIWEIFHGHLLAESHTRRTEEFETWNVYLDDSSQPAETPLASVRWQGALSKIYVVRRILTHGFEAYEDAPGVILSREAQKWVAELVATIDLAAITPDDLGGELRQALYLAVIGTSRLPITSLESPLPAFSLGQMAYLPGLAEADRPADDPREFLRAAMQGDLSIGELSKVLEFTLRATPPEAALSIAEVLREGSPQHREEPGWRSALFRALFNSAVLSPYTGYVDALVGVLLDLAARGEADAAETVDTIGYMLRHLCRHLTAFDLSVFHNFGANYPDALFLDALLIAYLHLIDRHPELFWDDSAGLLDGQALGRRRRRALRQACLVRVSYEGHRVPDAPTSMGENARVLPGDFARVPEDQILQAARRSRRLYEGRPLTDILNESARWVLARSFHDLEQPAEARELGMAVFLDRPLGVVKPPGEVDRTPLLSYEAFSRSIAARRLEQAKTAGWIDEQAQQRIVEVLDDLPPAGRALADLAPRERQGVVSLADAAKAASDFRILRTTRGSLTALLGYYDLSELEEFAPEFAEWLHVDRHILLVSHSPADRSLGQATLRLYDRQDVLRLELAFETTPGQGVRYRERGGFELAERLRVLLIAETDAEPARHVSDRSVWLRLK